MSLSVSTKILFVTFFFTCFLWGSNEILRPRNDNRYERGHFRNKIIFTENPRRMEQPSTSIPHLAPPPPQHSEMSDQEYESWLRILRRTPDSLSREELQALVNAAQEEEEKKIEGFDWHRLLWCVFAVGIVFIVYLVWWISYLKNKRKKQKDIQEAKTKEVAERKAEESAAFEVAEKAKWEKTKAEKAAQEAKEAQQKADQTLLKAMNELEIGNMDKLTWAKALIAADGDEKRAKIEYLKLRR